MLLIFPEDTPPAAAPDTTGAEERKLWWVDATRTWQLAVLTIPLLVLVYFIAPQQLGILVYKSALILGSPIGAYIIDRVVFPYARPDGTGSQSDMHAQYRRAAIIVGAMLAAGIAA